MKTEIIKFNPLPLITETVNKISDGMTYLIEANKTIPTKIENYIDEFRADIILDSYSIGLKGLQDKTCQNLGINFDKCKVLKKVLGNAFEGVVTKSEAKKLKKVGFSPVFIKTLRGKNGKKPLEWQIKWLFNYLSAPFDGKGKDMRWVLINKIERMEKKASKTIPLMISLLKIGSTDIRQAAASALGKIPSKQKEKLSAIKALMESICEDPSPAVRNTAVRALVYLITKYDIKSMPKLIETLKKRYKEENNNVQRAISSVFFEWDIKL